MKHLKKFLGATLLLFMLLASSTQLSAQTVDYEALSDSPNIECVKLSGLMLKMGMSASKQGGANGEKIAKAFEGVKKMYVFSSENKKGREELIKGFAPLIDSKKKNVEVLVEQKDQQEGEHVRIIGVTKGKDRFELLLVFSVEPDEVDAVVMIGDMGKEDLLVLAKSAN